MTRPVPTSSAGRHRLTFAARAGIALGATSMVLAACGGSSDANSTSTDGEKLTTVTLAMDYLPGPSHNGLAYAMNKGLFEKQGIKVKMIPYVSAVAETVVGSGKADLGLSAESGAAMTSFASGSDLRSIFLVQPKPPFKLAVLESSGITSPAGLAGKTEGGYGAPLESSLIDAMIKNDGGDGKIKMIVLSTGAVEALKSKRVDSTLLYPDAAYDLDQQGIAVRQFNAEDYGVPAGTGINVIGASKWLEGNADLTRRFLTALQEGYEVALDDPKAANDALVAEFPEVNRGLADFVGNFYAKEVLPNTDGPIGTLDPTSWTTYANWLAENKLLVDKDGKTLSTFDPTPFLTNEYLPD